MATLELPEGIQIMAVMREGVRQALGPELAFKPGDYVYVLAQPKFLPEANKLFDPHQAPDRLEEHRYFGDFVLNGDATLADLADVYGLDIPEHHAGKTLAAYLDQRFHGRVVVGDRASLGNAVVVVREMHEGRVSRVGLKLR
jgi:cell volume regulation protein A